MVLNPDDSRSRSRACKAAPVLEFGGEKGGIGKSFLARIIVYFLTKSQVRWAGFDLDTRNAHLSRFNQGASVTRLDWTQPLAWDQLYGAIMHSDSSTRLVIDLPAQVGQVLPRERPRLAATVCHLQRPLLSFWCLAHSFDSVNLLSQSLGQMTVADTFVVKNLHVARREDFELWARSKTREVFLAAGGTEVWLPLLPSGVANAIEAADLPFADALTRLREPWLLYDLESYLAEIEVEFAPVLRRIV